jgi:malate dehydrogenase (oxaloacetate-decarboxylating)
MIMSAAKALAALSPTLKNKKAPLLPPITDSRKVSLPVAEAVGKQAIEEGLAGVADERSFEKELREYVWEPVYLPYVRLSD